MKGKLKIYKVLSLNYKKDITNFYKSLMKVE